MVTLKRRIADSIVLSIDFFAKTLGARFYELYLDLIAREYNKIGTAIKVTIAGQKVHFAGHNRMTKWRTDTLFTKEPATLSWIDRFSPGAIMWDIGANIGLYSVYAAVSRGANVLAFEPSPANYAVLCENVELNKLSKQIAAFPIALNDKCEIGTLSMKTMDAGFALSNFGIGDIEKVTTISSLGYSIDGFIETFNPQFPEYIKIDVDGIEEKILLGAKRTLCDSRLRSVYVEGDESQSGQIEKIKKIMVDSGLQFVDSYRSPLYPKTPFKNLYFARL